MYRNDLGNVELTHQNSPSYCDLDAKSSRSRSLSAFHSQLRSDQAPVHMPPHSLPAHGLRSLIRFVSCEPLLLLCDESDVVLTLASPVTQ
jgi:hypothetical protein